MISVAVWIGVRKWSHAAAAISPKAKPERPCDQRCGEGRNKKQRIVEPGGIHGAVTYDFGSRAGAAGIGGACSSGGLMCRNEYSSEKS